MSHVAEIAVEILDLDALKLACADLGLKFNEGAKTYKWYGRSVGDYPLPQGFKASDLGKCEHSISVLNDNGDVKADAYEIGVVARRDGKAGYQLLWDFYAGGFGLTAKIGKDGDKLKQRYTAQASMRVLRRKGFQGVKETMRNGKVVITASS